MLGSFRRWGISPRTTCGTTSYRSCNWYTAGSKLSLCAYASIIFNSFFPPSFLHPSGLGLTNKQVLWGFVRVQMGMPTPKFDGSRIVCKGHIMTLVMNFIVGRVACGARPHPVAMCDWSETSIKDARDVVSALHFWKATVSIDPDCRQPQLKGDYWQLRPNFHTQSLHI